MGGAGLEALAAQARESLPRFASMDVADTLWAFAKLGHNVDNSLLQDFEAHITRIRDTFTPQQLVRCCTRPNRECPARSAHVVSADQRQSAQLLMHLAFIEADMTRARSAPVHSVRFLSKLRMLQVMVLGAYSMMNKGMGRACLEALTAQADAQRPRFATRKYDFVQQSLAKLRRRR